MTLVANQRSAQYILDMFIYQGYSDLVMFADDMGCDRGDKYQSFAYGIKGKPPKFVLEASMFLPLLP